MPIVRTFGITSNVGTISLNHLLFDATDLAVEVGDAVEIDSQEGENDLVGSAKEAGWSVYSLLNHLNPLMLLVYTRTGKPGALLERSVI